MKHKAYGKALLLGVFAVAGCYSYASDAINNENYHKVDASPNFIVQKVGDSDRVIVRLINDANNSAITTFTVSAVGAGIRVDSSCTVPDLDQAHQIAASCNGYYRPIFSSGSDTLVPNGPGDAQQFFVVGLTPGQYTFVLTPTSVNTGVSRTVTVVIKSADLGPALSKTTAVAGDTITLTAPVGSVFSSKSVITFPTGTLSQAGISADSTQLTFVAGPGITGPATVTLVGTAANPAADKATLVTTNTLTTPQIVGPSLNPTTQAAGGTVVLTAAPNTVFSQTSAISITAGPTPPITARSADSTTISFIVGPGDSGAITVTKIGVKNAPVLGTFTATSTNSLTLVPPITVAPTTVSNLTPAIGVPITVTLGGGLRFLSTSHVFIGGVEAGVTGVTADSSTATVTPLAYSTGNITYTNIALSFLNSVQLSVPGDKSVTVGAAYAGPVDAGSGAVGTASTYVQTNKALVVSDVGTFTTPCGIAAFGTAFCQYYKITVQAGATAGRIVWTAATTADLGVYTLNAAGTNFGSEIADEGGPATGTTGDVGPGTSPTLTAGTILFGVVQFSPITGIPSWFQFRISQQ